MSGKYSAYARAVDADFVAFSVYKFFGPHLGALYGRREIMAGLPSYKVRPAGHRFETGTGNFEGAAGAAAAVEYLADLGSRYGGAPEGAGRRERIVAGMHAIRAYELDLYRHLVGRLGEVEGIAILGLTAEADMERRTPTAAITIPGLSPRAVADRLGLGPATVNRRLSVAQSLWGRARVVETRAIEGVGRVAYFRDPDGNILGVIEPQRVG